MQHYSTSVFKWNMYVMLSVIDSGHILNVLQFNRVALTKQIKSEKYAEKLNHDD